MTGLRRQTLAAALLALAVLAPSASAAAKTYSCSIASVPLAYPDKTLWHFDAVVPFKAATHIIITGAGAPGNEWTGFHWSYREGSLGIAVDMPVFTLFLTTGPVDAQIVDVGADGSVSPITACSFAVT